jgi:hypothetical protein
MNPEVWGPHYWFMMHSITFSYPMCPTNEDKKNIKNFFVNIGNVLPCFKCRSNYDGHMKKRPLTNTILCSRDRLIKWAIDIHNDVNEDNGKHRVSYNEVTSKYNNINNNNTLLELNIILLVFIFLVVFLLYITPKIKKMFA